MQDFARLAFAVETKDLKLARIELDKLAKQGKKTETATKGLDKGFKSAAASIFNMRNAMVGLVATMGLRELTRYADEMTLVDSKLKLVTSTTAQLIEVQSELFDIAQESRVGFSDTVDLYSRMARSTQELGLSSEELLLVTDNISKSLIISGGSAESMNAALVQLGQGFASGQLRGQELNSVLEQTPRLARMISDGMGIAYGDLRKYAEQGLITSEALINAIKSQTNAVGSEFGSMTMTVGQSVTQIDNSFMMFVGTLDDITSATDILSSAFSSASSILDDFREKLIDFDNTVNTINDISDKSGIDIWTKQLQDAKSKLAELSKDGRAWYENEKQFAQDVANQKWYILKLEKLISDEKKKQSGETEEVSKKTKELTQKEIDAKIKGHKEVNAHVEAYYKRQEELHEIDLALTEIGTKFAIDTQNAKYASLSFELEILKEQSMLIRDMDERGIATAEANFNMAQAELDHLLAIGTLTDSQYAKKMDLQQKYHDKVIFDYSYAGQAIDAIGDSMESNFASFFDYSSEQALDFGELMKGILHDIYMDLIRNLVIKQLVSGITSAMTGGGDLTTSDYTSVSEASSYAGYTPNAIGNVYSSPSLSAHSNSIVSSPTPFMFATGGVPNLGVMGEAGSEAIMPLTRTSGGDLGVKVQGTELNVSIINNTDTTATAQTDDSGNLTIVLDAVANSIKYGTGSVGPALEQSYGLSR